MRGKFIVFEGLDGSGKTVQLELLAQRLKERLGEDRVHVTREPSDNPVGSLIRSALRGEISLEAGTLALLFAADRCEHLSGEIIPALERGITVLCDRFYLSNLAYQGRFIGPARLLSYNEDAVSRLRADATFFLDVSPEECVRRIAESRKKAELYEKLDVLREVREGYLSAIEALKDKEQVFIIDSGKDVRSVSEAVWDIASKIIT